MRVAWAGYAGAMAGFMLMLHISFESGARKASLAEYILTGLGIIVGGAVSYFVTFAILAPENTEGPQ